MITRGKIMITFETVSENNKNSWTIKQTLTIIINVHNDITADIISNT